MEGASTHDLERNTSIPSGEDFRDGFLMAALEPGPGPP